VISNAEVAVRILVAAVFAALLGIERELREQAAGLRTHIIVGVGSCLFTLTSAYGFEALAKGTDVGVRADVTRVASQIVVGVGFLGGGAILRHGTTIKGLTTAANLWVVAAVGLAVGIGMYLAAGLTTIVALASLAGLKPLEARLARNRGGDGTQPPSPMPPD
jgi:putative Mg2+ transporter-C (MgtC) family protein